MSLWDHALSAALSEKRLAVIWGCQSSGANAFADILCTATRARRLPEQDSILSPRQQGLQWASMRQVRQTISQIPEKHLIVTPLADSHLAHRHLEALTDMRGLWWVRPVLPSISQDLKRHPKTAGQGNIQPIMDNCEWDWRNQGISTGTRALLHQLYNRTLPQADLAALFWYARNRLYFEQDLHREAQVECLFEPQIFANPRAVAEQLRMHLRWPTAPSLAHLRSPAVTHGIKHPLIRHLCQHLYKQLVFAQARRRQNKVNDYPKQAAFREAANASLLLLKSLHAKTETHEAPPACATMNVRQPSVSEPRCRTAPTLTRTAKIDLYA